MENGMSRRGFLAAAAGTLAAASVAGCSSPANSSSEAGMGEAASAEGTVAAGAQMGLTPTFDFEWYPPMEGEVAYEESEIEETSSTVECDMLVCGAGLAGACAALSGIQNGLNVVVLEKGSQFSGRGAQIGALNSNIQKQSGAEEIDITTFVDDGMYSMGNRANRSVWMRYANFSGKAADWLADSLGDACGSWLSDSMTTLYNNGVPFWACTVQPETMAETVAPAIGDILQGQSVDIRFGTPVVQLVEEDEKVVGAIGKDADGNYIRFSASKGVVLATGGYENNWEMMCKYIEPRDLAVGTWRNPLSTNTGDGHLMGEAVGGQMDDYPHTIMTDPGASVKSHTYCRPLAQGFLRVNDRGKRFCNEAASQEHVGAAIAQQPHAHCYVIIGGDLEESITELFTKRNLPFPVPAMVEAFQAEETQVETVDELAEIIGVDAGILSKTLEDYNRFYEQQNDEEFGKDASCLLPIAEGPFHVIEEQAAALVTTSGLKVDQYSRVLDQDANPIEGLYAIGNVSGSMFDSYYPHHCQAISHGRCVTFGYLVGRRLAGIED